MSRRGLLLIAILTVCPSATASGGSPPGDAWSLVAALPEGTRLVVVTKMDRRIESRLLSFRPGLLVLGEHTDRQNLIATADIKHVVRLEKAADSLLNGVLTGAAVGAAVGGPSIGLLAQAMNETGGGADLQATAYGALLGAGFGALIGLGADALRSEWREAQVLYPPQAVSQPGLRGATIDVMADSRAGRTPSADRGVIAIARALP